MGDPFPIPPTWSQVDQLRALPDHEIDRILGALTNEERASLKWAHHGFWLRPDVRAEGAQVGTGQEVPPGDHIYVVFQGGRAGGKSFACMIAFADDAHAMGDEFVGFVLCENDEEARRLITDKRSGMRAILPPWKRPEFSPSIEGGVLTFPSGAMAYVMSSEKPSKGRSGNYNRGLIDDPPKFGPKAKEMFDTLMRALRVEGHGLRIYISTTPPGNNPPPRCPELLEHVLRAQLPEASDDERRDWVYSIGPSDDNLSNLDPAFKRILKSYEGTPDEEVERAGIYDPNAVTSRIFREIDFTVAPIRMAVLPERFDVITISIDPADSSNTHACEVGIVAAGLARGMGRAFLLEDASGLLSSDHWPDVAWELVERWAARAASWHFVIEVNRGTKDSTLLRKTEQNRRMRRGEQGVSICEIRPVTSREDKGARAAPLPNVYRAGQIGHARGLETCEAQMHRLKNVARQQTKLDRADAAVYALLDLFGLLDGQFTTPLGHTQSLQVGAFGASAQGSIAVGAEPRVMTMAPPGRGHVGAFGRSSW